MLNFKTPECLRKHTSRFHKLGACFFFYTPPRPTQKPSPLHLKKKPYTKESLIQTLRGLSLVLFFRFQQIMALIL